jgi:hypothetical protein
MLERMNPHSASSFEEFYKTHKKKRKISTKILYNLMYGLYRVYYKLFSKPNKAFEKLRIPIKIPCPIPDKFTQCPGRPSFLVHWGISMIENRYEIGKVDASL